MTIDEFERLTYAQLAEITGFDAPRWNRYLNYKRDITLNTILIAAQKLGMPLDIFIVAFCRRRKRNVMRKSILDGNVSPSGKLLDVTFKKCN